MKQSEKLYITEIYKSIQGESTWAGRPCTFVRLAGCPLRCKWCDTVYSFKQSDSMAIEQIISEIKSLGIQLVELTGGEPLAQTQSKNLLHALDQLGYSTMIETSGSESIAGLPQSCKVIMDIKCPDSKMSDKNLWTNIPLLKQKDEVKFVIASQNDFEWAYHIIKKFDLENICTVLLSPAFGLIKEAQLVDWLLESKLNARLNMQIHKYIWSPRKKGV